MVRPKDFVAKTILVEIGNSDDHLTQVDWSHYCESVLFSIREKAQTVFSSCYSLTNSPWQNACFHFSILLHRIPQLQEELQEFARFYNQKSIAWSETSTEFLKGEEHDTDTSTSVD